MKRLLLILILLPMICISQYKVTKIDKEFGLMSDNVKGVWHDDEGYIWVADEIGFNKINGNEVINYPTGEGKLFGSAGTNRITYSNGVFKFLKNDFKGKFQKGNYQKEEFTKKKGYQARPYNQYMISGLDTALIRKGYGLTEGTEKLILEYLSGSPDSIIIYNIDGKSVDSKSLDFTFYPIYISKSEIDRFSVEPNLSIPFFTPVKSDHLNIYLRKRNGIIIKVNSNLETTFLNIPDSKYIVDIDENSKGNFYVIRLGNQFLFEYDSDGKLVNKLKLPAGYNAKVRLVKNKDAFYLWDYKNNKRYILKNNELLEIKIEIRRRGFPFEMKSGVVLYSNDNKSFISSGNNTQLIKRSTKSITEAFEDSEGIIWVQFSDELYRLSESPMHNVIPDFINHDPPHGLKWIQSYNYNTDSTIFAFRINNGRSILYVNDLKKSHLDSILYEDVLEINGVYANRYFICRLYDSKSKKHKKNVIIDKTNLNVMIPFWEKKSNFAYANGYLSDLENKLFSISNDLSINEIKTFDPYISMKNITGKTEGGLVFQAVESDNKNSDGSPVFSYIYWLVSNQNISKLFNSQKIYFSMVKLGENILLASEDDWKVYNLNKSHIVDSSATLNTPNRKSRVCPVDESTVCFTKDGRLFVLSIDSGISETSPKLVGGNGVVDNLFTDISLNNIYVISGNIVYSFPKNKIKYSSIQLNKELDIQKKNDGKSFYIEEEKGYLNFFFSNSIVRKKLNFEPSIKSLNSNIKSISVYNQKGNLLTTSNKEEDNLTLKYDQNSLVFKLETNSNFEPATIYYLYQLDGPSGSDKWIKSDIDSIQLSNLSPGIYTFRFKVINGYGIESDIIEYSFTINPPWHQTWWFRTTAGAGILLLFFIFYKVRTKQMRKRQEVLEETVEERTSELVEQKEIVEEKNNEILDSINYAKRIQSAILPPPKLVKQWLNDSFIYYKPKDIVAGDFYWMETTKREGKDIVMYAAADCTGHGVPGAMVSVVCSNAMNRAIKEFEINDPAKLLDKVVELVRESFEKSEDLLKDGMDIALCAIDLESKTLWFSGAHNPLYRITNDSTVAPEDSKVIEEGDRKLVEYKADKQPVGAFDHMKPFTTTEIKLEDGDVIYTSSDGFPDQFGGEKGKKYKYGAFKKFLLSIEKEPIDKQKDLLDSEFERWKGDLEQVDDVCVIGLRV